MSHHRICCCNTTGCWWRAVRCAVCSSPGPEVYWLCGALPPETQVGDVFRAPDGECYVIVQQVTALPPGATVYSSFDGQFDVCDDCCPGCWYELDPCPIAGDCTEGPSNYYVACDGTPPVAPSDVVRVGAACFTVGAQVEALPPGAQEVAVESTGFDDCADCCNVDDCSHCQASTEWEAFCASCPDTFGIIIQNLATLCPTCTGNDLDCLNNWNACPSSPAIRMARSPGNPCVWEWDVAQPCEIIQPVCGTCRTDWRIGDQLGGAAWSLQCILDPLTGRHRFELTGTARASRDCEQLAEDCPDDYLGNGCAEVSFRFLSVANSVPLGSGQCTCPQDSAWYWEGDGWPDPDFQFESDPSILFVA